MNTKDFVDFGKAAIDFVANYMDTLRDRNVLPNVEPGYLSQLLPEEAPKTAETWQDVLKDVEQHIMPGVTHWNSPHFHAFYPTGNSYPAIVGEILSNGIGCIGLSWISSPACTELEVITMNWLGKLIGLPEEFLNCSSGPGGGVIQGSASEATLVGLLVAKEKTLRHIQKLHPDWEDGFIKSKLVAYTSDQSNSSVEKAGIIASVPMRLLPTDDQCTLRGETLLKAIKEDLEKGLIPCYLVATLGTTGTCAFDNLSELGPICNEYDVWMHVDAAYAAAAFVCPEYRYLMAGVEYVDSFNMNAHKWLLVNFDCSPMWVKNSRYLLEALSVDRIYLAHDKEGQAPDYRNWQISLGRRFRALKLWFVLRLYGVDGLQSHIRHAVSLAQIFKEYVISDDRFELVTDVIMGLICFRIKGDDCFTKELITRLTARKKIYVIPATYREKLIVRFVICSRLAQKEDIIFAWNEITGQTTEILRSKLPPLQAESQVPIKKPNDITAMLETLNLEKKNTSQKIS